jgi:hypothetical protein
MTTITRLNYCQFLLISQPRYTLIYFDEQCRGYSNNAVKRFLDEETLTARMVGESVKGQVFS